MAETAYALNLGQLRKRTLELCREEPYRNDDGVWVSDRWDSAQDVLDLKEYINHAVKDFCNETRMLKTHQIIQIFEKIFLYELNPDVFRVHRVWFSDFEGYCVIPAHSICCSSRMSSLALESDPWRYFRDHIPRNKVWVWPVPYRDGSSFETDTGTIYGLLRAVQDEDGNYLPFDANYALRKIDGCYFEASGDGRIIRQLISHTGNLRIDYERYPVPMGAEGDYPDSEIPEHHHQEIPFLAAHAWLEYKGETPEDYQLSDRREGQADKKIVKTRTEPFSELIKGGFRPG